MRRLRGFAAVLAVTSNAFIGGYLLLRANGVYIAMRERGTVWEGMTPLPSYPVAHILGYLIIAIVLQSVFGWLLMSSASRGNPASFWFRYTARVGVCIAACVVAAFVMIFGVMALLDGGTI